MLRVIAPDHIAELALIEMSKLQRWAIVFAIPDEEALKIAADCSAEIARRKTPETRKAA